MIQNITIGRIYSGNAGDILAQEKIVDPSILTQEIVPDSGYQCLSKVIINPIPIKTLNTPNISIDTVNERIYSTIYQPDGYVQEGIKTAELNLNIYKGSSNIIPGIIDINIGANTYISDGITIKGDSNLKAENIKEGINIFGITGTHAGSNSKLNALLYGGADNQFDLLLDDFTPYTPQKIRDYMFMYNKGLRKCILPDYISTIGMYAFYHCSNMNTLKLPEGIHTIEEGAFTSCSSLTEVTIPASLNSIQSTAFAGCTGLKKITWKSSRNIPSGCFQSCQPDIFDVSNAGYVGLGPENFTSSKHGILITNSDDLSSYKNSTWANYFTNIIPNGRLVEDIDDKLIISSDKNTPNITIITVPIYGEWDNPTFSTKSSDDRVILTISNFQEPEYNGVIYSGSIDLSISAAYPENNNYSSECSITITAESGESITKTFNIDVFSAQPQPYLIEFKPKVDGATYGFTYNTQIADNDVIILSGTENTGIDSSYAICEYRFFSYTTDSTNTQLLIELTQSSENNYDYVVLSTLDTPLTLSNNSDDSLSKFNTKGISNGVKKQFIYDNIPYGEHFIQIKYLKDGSGSDGDDTVTGFIDLEIYEK